MREARAAGTLDAEGLPHDGFDIALNDPPSYRSRAPLTGGKRVTIYGQTEVTRDLMDKREADGAPTIYDAQHVTPRDFAGRTSDQLREGRRAPPDRRRFHHRLRRLPRRLAQGGAAEGDRDLRAGLSFRLARPARRRAAGPGRAGLWQACGGSRSARCARRPEPLLISRCRLTDRSRTGRTKPSGTSCAGACPEQVADAVVTGPSFEKSIAPLRSLSPSRCGSARCSSRGRRAYRAADRAKG